MSSINYDRLFHRQDVHAAWPLAADVPPWATFTDTDLAHDTYVRLFDAAGAPTWYSTGALRGGWGKYVVSVQATPEALYRTIGDAITAAHDDGHDNGNPAVVLVMPGDYLEQVTLRAGIFVRGLCADGDQDGPFLEGNVTRQNESGSFGFAGFVVEPDAGTAIDLSGATAHLTTISECTLIGVLSGIDTSSAFANTIVRDCDVRAGDAAAFGIRQSDTKSSLLIERSRVSGFGFPTIIAISSAGNVEGRALRTNGTVLVTGVSGRLLLDQACVIEGDTSAALAIESGAIAVARAGATMITTATPAVSSNAGGGTWEDGGAAFTENREIDSRLTQIPDRQALHLVSSPLSGAGPHTPGTSMASNQFVDAGNSAVVVNLPDVTAFQRGELVVIENVTTGTGTVTLDGSGSQTIAGQLQVLLWPGDAVTLRADGPNGRWMYESERRAIVANPTLYIDPAGNDLNAGTLASPLASPATALARLPKCIGTPTVVVANGTYALGAAPKLMVPNLGIGAASPVLFTGSVVDSGLGTRTATGASTQGSGSTFGTTTDTTGGLTVNGFKRYVQRWLAGAANAGRTYQVSRNTATVIAIEGTYTNAPVNTDPYVLETAGAVFSWASGVLTLRGDGAMVGFQHVQFVGPGGASGMEVYGVDVRVYDVVFNTFGTAGITLGAGAKLSNIAANSTIWTTTIPTTTLIGCYFSPTTAGSALKIAAADVVVNLSRSTFDGCTTEQQVGGGSLTITTTSYQDTAWTRFVYGGFVSITNFRCESVVPATALAFAVANGAICLGPGCTAIIQTGNISGTTGTGDAITVAGAKFYVQNVVGTTNGGTGLRMRKGAVGTNLLGNTVAGAATPNDVVIGVLAAGTWAASDAALINDLAVAATSELCVLTL